MNIKIKEMPINERPRERLINKGVRSLSDEELLAIVLKTGTKDMSAKALASQILKKIGPLRNLNTLSYHELVNIKGIGVAKACLILAIQELNKRINTRQETILNVRFQTADMIYEYYKNIVSDYQETFYCLFLDSNKRVIKEKLLFIGTVDYSMVHPRDIFKEAYAANATAFICVHNHPMGDALPSEEDIGVTNRLSQIGVLMGIKLVDHVIIGHNKYYSFLENGKI